METSSTGPLGTLWLVHYVVSRSKDVWSMAQRAGSADLPRYGGHVPK